MPLEMIISPPKTPSKKADLMQKSELLSSVTQGMETMMRKMGHLLEDQKLSDKYGKGLMGAFLGLFSLITGTKKPEENTEKKEEKEGEEQRKKPAIQEKGTTKKENEKVTLNHEQRDALKESISAKGEGIAAKALTYVNKVNENFRTEEVEGGSLACAKVVSTILKSLGLVSGIELMVDDLSQVLLTKGWKPIKGEPRKGDVVVWGPTGGYEGDGSGQEIPDGHKHIGIVVEDGSGGMAVSNSSRKKMPIKHKIYTGREVELILRAPA